MSQILPPQGVVAPVAQAGAPRAQYTEDFFIYTASVTNLAHGTTTNTSIQIQADSDFKWLKATADIRDHSSTTSKVDDADVTLQITDTGSARNLLLSAMPIDTFFGTGQLPFILPIPRIFRARASITLILANNDAAVDYDIQLAFIGTKIFRSGGNALAG